MNKGGKEGHVVKGACQIIMARTVKMNAHVRMELAVIIYQGNVLVDLAGEEKDVTNVRERPSAIIKKNYIYESSYYKF